MKTLLLFFFLFIPALAFSQTFPYNITGKISADHTPKYAYIVNYGQAGFLLKTQVVKQTFNFAGVIESKGAYYRTATLFLDDRDDITLDEIKSKFKQQIWMPGRDRNIKALAMENLTLIIDSAENLKNAEVLEKSSYTALMDELSLARKDKNEITFIKKYPDSPVSLDEIGATLKYFKLNLVRAETAFGSPEVKYNLLSERLKLSEQGIAVKKQIDEIYQR